MPYSVKGFLEVKEDNRAVLGAISGLCSAHVHDSGQEVLDGVIGASLFTESKLKRVEVVGVVQEGHQLVMDEVLEGPDDDAGQGDGAEGGRVCLITITFV